MSQHATVEPVTVNRWTAAAVKEHVATTANMDWATETSQDYQTRYVRPVEEFGLTIRLDPIRTPAENLLGTMMPRQRVPLSQIRSSTQVEGICLDVLDHYLTHPTVLVDSDGWFDNHIPVLYVRQDGTYTVRDGNHRCIAAMLRGDADIETHVVD